MIPAASEIAPCETLPKQESDPVSLGHSESASGNPPRELLRWLTTGRFSLLLALFSFVMFSEVWLGARTFFVRDFGIFSYPLAHHFRESFWRGEIPLWNPLNNCGIPFLAQWNTMACYPFSIFYLLLPLSWALGVFCLLHQILAGAGMFALALRWTNHRLAAGLAGVAFAFNGMTLNCLIWPHIMAALGWMPWVVLATQNAMQSGGRRVPVAALVGALQMLAGGPEVVLFTWSLVAGLLALDLLREPVARTAQLQRFAAVVLLVTALSAVQLAPFFDLLLHSQRNTSYGTAVSSLPATGWLNFFVPLFHCFRAPLGIAFQPEQFWTSSYYLGIGVTVLALAAIFASRDRRARLLAAATLGALLLALGDHTPLYPALKNMFPALGFMNYPVKFVLVAVFSVPLLASLTLKAFLDSAPVFAGGKSRFGNRACGGSAGHYLAELCSSRTEPKVARRSSRRTANNNRARCSISVAAIVSLVAIVGTIAFTRFSPVAPGEARMAGENGLVRIIFLAASLVLLVGLKRNVAAKTANLIGITFIALAWLDVATHAPSQNPTVPRSAYDSDLSSAMKWQAPPRAGESRAALSRSAQEQFEKCLVADPLLSYLGPRLALFSDCNLLDGIPKLDGFFPLFVREEREVQARLATASQDDAARWRDFVGVSQFTPEGKLFEWTPRATTMPLISAGQQPMFADDTTTLAKLASQNFSPRTEVFLLVAAKNSLSSIKAGDAQIVSRRFSAHRVEAEIETRAATVLVVAQTFYHPWRARVDGKLTQLRRANHAYQALPVPAGRHRVEITYEDRAFAFGAAISAEALALIVLLWFGKTTRASEDVSSSRPALCAR